MRRSLLILPVAVAVAAILVAVSTAGSVSAASSQSVHVRPSTGGPHTAFTVSVRIPVKTGTFGQFRRFDSLTATGPGRQGCVGSARAPLPARPAGSTVRVRLMPGHRSAQWCAGTFHGVVTQSETARCGGGPQAACPMLMIRPQTIGRFRFVVRHR